MKESLKDSDPACLHRLSRWRSPQESKIKNLLCDKTWIDVAFMGDGDGDGSASPNPKKYELSVEFCLSFNVLNLAARKRRCDK